MTISFGDRPIKIIYDSRTETATFVHKTEGWVIAEAYSLGDKGVTVWDGEGAFMGRVVGGGNIATLVSQIYDNEITPDKYVWVIFGMVLCEDGEIDFSREIDAPTVDKARELFSLDIGRQFDDIHYHLSIRASYGPYVRIEE